MDELLRHCRRELAFDGNFGCNISQLKKYISEFYAHGRLQTPQKVDGAFCSFVWLHLARDPGIRIGFIPTGVISSVRIAPQNVNKRKTREEESSDPFLEPVIDAQAKSLDELYNLYGDRLRIAVDESSIRGTIAGSHMLSAELTPMVYTALQLIAQGRGDGITMMGLGQQSGYDQKTCHYLVEKLLELDLVVKIRLGGIRSHSLIHKYFFQRSAAWKVFREEQTQQDLEGDSTLNFTPIDERQFASMPLIRGRIIQLLKASKNHLYPAQNIISAIGFHNPTKADRRWFSSCMRIIMEEGVIGKVSVPSNKRGSHAGATTMCFQLVDATTLQPALSLQLPQEDEAESEPEQAVESELSNRGVRANATVQKQIIDLLCDADKCGMTIQDICRSLGQMDKRTVEFILSRVEKSTPPAHLLDFSLTESKEGHGREQRKRYYITRAYRDLLVEERLDDSSLPSAIVDSENIGFMPVDPSLFYDDSEQLENHQDSFKRQHRPNKKPPKNPVFADGTVKRGRPRKQPYDEFGNPYEGRSKVVPKKRKRYEDPEQEVVTGGTRRKKRKKDKGEAEVTDKQCDPVSSQNLDTEEIPKLPQTREKEQDEEGDRADNAVASNVGNKEPESEQEGSQGRATFSLPALGQRRSLRRRPANAIASVSGPSYDPVPSRKRRRLSAIADTDPTEMHTGRDLPPPSPPVVATAGNGVATTALQITAGNNVRSTGDSVAGLPEGLPPGDSPSTADGVENTGDVTGDVPSTSQPATGAETPQRIRPNVSNLRRENEIYQVIELLGGAANIHTKEIFEGHMSLLSELTKKGVPTSAPIGTRIDKRTLLRTIQALEDRGRVRILKTSLPSMTGVNRVVTIAHLPDTTDDKISAFLSQLARPSTSTVAEPHVMKRLDEPIDYGLARSPGTSPQSPRRPELPVELLHLDNHDTRQSRVERNKAQAQKLFQYDDTVIRDVLLHERTTLYQVYGTIVSKVLRARQLHLITLSLFEQGSNSPFILSHDKRIVDISYYLSEISLALYCSLIPCKDFQENVLVALNDPSQRHKRIADLPEIHSILNVGRARSRNKVLSLLECLRDLNLAFPLQASSSETAWLTCTDPDERPLSFDRIDSQGQQSLSTTWLFADDAPIFIWSASQKPPPLWKILSVHSVSDATVYWQNLQTASTNDEISYERSYISTTLTPSTSLGKLLKKSSSWTTTYSFTWHQTMYMNQYVDFTTGCTPLDSADSGEPQLQRISQVIAAPTDAIRKHFAECKTSITQQLDKSRQSRTYQMISGNLDVTMAPTDLLAQKALESRERRAQEWELLLQKVHPRPLENHAAVRVKNVKKRFLQSVNIDEAKWMQAIANAIKEAELAAKKILKPKKKSQGHTGPVDNVSPPPAITLNRRDKPVIELIAQQGSVRPKPQQRKKGQKKSTTDAADDSTPTQTRQRFPWNSEYEELARDACVIIRARCRATRIDWTALEQVFPSIPRNSVRQRLASMRENVAQDAYLNRLEDCWYELWVKHRGSSSLPDDNPESPTKFDLISHIEFLRNHVDKSAIRAGYTETTEHVNHILPESTAALLSGFDITEDTSDTPSWEFMWNAGAEEARGKRLTSAPFTKTPEEKLFDLKDTPDFVSLAESALKVVLGTPAANYKPEKASKILHSIGDDHVRLATHKLLNEGIISKVESDPKKERPGRQLKISEASQNQLGGIFLEEVYQDASALKGVFPSHQWHDWSLVATDGEIASLLQTVLESKVDFKIDTTNVRRARVAIDWNSKKASDDDIETLLQVRFKDVEPSVASSMSIQDEGTIAIHSHQGHGKNTDGLAACCKQNGGVVDCSVCLDEQWALSATSYGPDDLEVAELIRWLTSQAGRNGVTMTDLEANLKMKPLQLESVIRRMTMIPVPLLYWIGYSSIHLVSASYIGNWTITVSESPTVKVFPRRWIDIHGVKLTDVWEAGIRNVIGCILFHPGLPLSHLRWHVRNVYDRQELHEILRYLVEESMLVLKVGDELTHNETADLHKVFMADKEEERRIHLFIRPTARWYEI